MDPYTGSDERFPTTVDIPDDADLAAPQAAMWNTATEAILDGLASLKSRLLTWQLSGAAATWHFGQKVALAYPAGNANSRWTAWKDGTDLLLGWIQHDVTDSGKLTYEVLPPHAMAQLWSVEARVAGDGYGGGPHVALPGTMPYLVLYTVDDGVVTLIDSQVDTSATKDIYDAPHMIRLGALPSEMLGAITLGTRILVGIMGEAGANKLPDALVLYDLTCHWLSQAAP